MLCHVCRVSCGFVSVRRNLLFQQHTSLWLCSPRATWNLPKAQICFLLLANNLYADSNACSDVAKILTATFPFRPERNNVCQLKCQKCCVQFANRTPEYGDIQKPQEKTIGTQRHRHTRGDNTRFLPQREDRPLHRHIPRRFLSPVFQALCCVASKSCMTFGGLLVTVHHAFYSSFGARRTGTYAKRKNLASRQRHSAGQPNSERLDRVFPMHRCFVNDSNMNFQITHNECVWLMVCQKKKHVTASTKHIRVVVDNSKVGSDLFVTACLWRNSPGQVRICENPPNG